MSSNYTGLGVQLMTTGEKAGTWGTLTNTNWNIIEQISGGYTTQAVTDGADTDLSVSDGATGATLAHRTIELTGSLTSGRNVTIPLDVQTFYIIKNATTGSQVVTFKYVTGSGNSVAIANGETVLVYATANDVTNPDIDDAGFGTGLAAVVDDTTPQLGGNLDVNGNDIVSVSNADIDIIPNGSGDVNLGTDTVQVGDLNVDATITTQGTGDLILNTNNGTNSGNITIADAANGDITITPDGTGEAKAVDAADATGAIKIAGLETMWVPAVAMYAETTNGAELTQTVLSAGNPELKAMAFDTSTAEAVQFNVCFPKSWAFGTDVTFQTFWSASSTDTGTGGFTLAGCSVANDIDYDLAFGTPVANTALAASGTQDDLMVNVVSGGVTIASRAASTNTIFRLVRNTGTDTNTGDLRLVGIKLFYTTDAANDA